MKKDSLLFKFNGYYKFLSNEDNDFENRYRSNTLFEFLERNQEIIEEQIKTNLNNLFSNRINSSVKIRFSKGSIFWDGAVSVFEALDLIGGNIAILIYLVKAIKFCIDKVILAKTNEYFSKHSHIELEIVTTVEMPSENIELNIRKNDSPSSGIFTTRTILIALTLFNLIVFLGGNVYNFVTIESVQNKHNDVIRVMDETKNKYENFVSSLTNDYSNYKNVRDTLDSRIDSVKYLIQETTLTLSKLKAKNEEMLKTDYKYTALDVWRHSNWFLNAIMVIFLILTLWNTLILIRLRR